MSVIMHDIARSVYNATIRPHLPFKGVTRNGVYSRGPGVRKLDRVNVIPSYKSSLAALLREHVCQGDSLIEVGAGMGVLTTIAAQQGATVQSFEGASMYRDISRRTLQDNGVQDRAKITHAIVGDPHDVWDSVDDVRRVDAADLPAADHLLLDCEGSELSIIEAAARRYTNIFVEAHPDIADVSPADVRESLTDAGYAVVGEYTAGYHPGKAALHGAKA